MRTALNLLSITPKQAGWDATLQTNFERISEIIKQFDMQISVQGSTASPSTINIQLKDADGNNIAETFLLRCRICKDDAFAQSTNANIGITGSTTVYATHTANKEYTFQSTAAGLIQVSLVNSTAETVQLRIGPPTICAPLADYTASLKVTHA
jgi:hypothetical protein